MSVYEAFNLMFQFGMFIIGLVTLMVTLIMLYNKK